MRAPLVYRRNDAETQIAVEINQGTPAQTAVLIVVRPDGTTIHGSSRTEDDHDVIRQLAEMLLRVIEQLHIATVKGMRP